MGLFWNRKKKDASEGEAPKQSLFNRLMGREAEAPKPSEESSAVQSTETLTSAGVAPAIETPASPEVIPSPVQFQPAALPPVAEPITPPAVSVPSPTSPQPETSGVVPPTPALVEPGEPGGKSGFLSRFFGRGQSEAPTAPLPPPPTPVEVITPTLSPEEEARQKFFYRFKNAVQKTRENIVGRLDTLLRGQKVINAQVMDDLEEILLGSDIGVQTTLDLVEKIRKQVDRNQINNVDELKRLLKSELLAILTAPPPKRNFGGKSVASELELADDIRPYVMMMVGVNGVGKTTTIAKLANLIKKEGNKVLICAADTFRAAASDQLAVWAQRTQVDLVQQKPGTDPAAVVFDSLQAAKARDADVVIIDTAGRLHTKTNLMQELEKMTRIAKREVPQAPHEVLLVIDAVTGQNGLEQARQFTRSVAVTGIVLTKLDGTAKGGIVVAISKELGIPIRYVGIGEQMDDLVVFSPEDYVNGLFE